MHCRENAFSFLTAFLWSSTEVLLFILNGENLQLAIYIIFLCQTGNQPWQVIGFVNGKKTNLWNIYSFMLIHDSILLHNKIILYWINTGKIFQLFKCFKTQNSSFNSVLYDIMYFSIWRYFDSHSLGLLYWVFNASC